MLKTESELRADYMKTEEELRSDYLMILRRCSKLETLEQMAELRSVNMTSKQLCVFYGCVDHRKVEIITGKLYNKIPKSAWKLI